MRLFGTEEAALESRETTFAKVSPQLSMFPEGDNIPSIRLGEKGKDRKEFRR